MKPEQVQQTTRNVLAALQQSATWMGQLIQHCDEVQAADAVLRAANKSLTEQVAVLQKRLEETEGSAEFADALRRRHEEAVKKAEAQIAISKPIIERLKPKEVEPERPVE